MSISIEKEKPPQYYIFSLSCGHSKQLYMTPIDFIRLGLYKPQSKKVFCYTCKEFVSITSEANKQNST